MAREDKIESGASSHAEENRGVSRREVLTGASVVAAGVVTAATAPALAAPDNEAGLVGVAKPGVNAGEFSSWVFQSGTDGETFVAYGFLTRLAGATDEDLFAGEPYDLSTALLTIYAEGALQQRVFGVNVHSLDVVGSLSVYQRTSPGASLGDPDSFQAGTPVARFSMTLQNVLTVFAPGRGLPTLTGDLQQTFAGRISLTGKPNASANFGRMGTRARLLATGLGQRPNPATFDTQFEMGGNWTIE
jgi:hypothetical protein